MAKSFEELFLEKIKAEVERYTEDVVMGSANDYSEYREKVGFLRGMMSAVGIFEEIINRARKENLND